MVKLPKFAKNLVGLRYDEAVAIVKENGWKLRCREVDGKGMVGDTQSIPTRLNVAVADNKVKKILGIG